MSLLSARTLVMSAVFMTLIAAAPPHKSLPQRTPYDVDWYIHPQRLVNIGTRRLNILCTGEGSPTVILEAGTLAASTAWRRVQQPISRTTRVCSYDRAGLGFSDSAGPPRDAAAIVHDLRAVLRGARIAPPYVLVGWSSGGLYSRLYQYQYPDEIVGLVEVDPDSEFGSDDAKIVTDIMKKPPQWYNQQENDWYKEYDNCAINVSKGTCVFFPGGLAAFREQQRATGCPKVSPEECAVKEEFAEHLVRASLWKDEALEVRGLKKSEAEVRAAERPYRDLPLIVLTDSEEGDIDLTGSPISAAAQRATWVAKNKRDEQLAKQSCVGAHFVIADSSHAIQFVHPSVVISAVDEVVDQARHNRH